VLLVTSILLLKSGQVPTLKTSIIGYIITTNLLNTGLAFFLGGIRRSEQFFNVTVVQTMNLLLFIIIIALVLPTASALLSQTPIHTITRQSRGTAVILIIIYCLFLYFELLTHRAMFSMESMKVAMRPRKRKLPLGGVVKGLAAAGGVGAAVGRPSNLPYDLNSPTGDEIMDRSVFERVLHEQEEEVTEPRLHIYVCIATLIIGTTILAFNTKFMTDSIEGLVANAGVPRDFIGIVLLPILSNDLSAIQLAAKDQMDVAIQAALGKSLQATLLVTPILVLVGWGLNIDDMNLYFDGFQVVALFASVLSMQNGIADGKSNW
jgi:Ca2+:H+ antiporter